MYEQNENPWGRQPQQQRPSRSSSNLMATAALICAILGIVLSCTFYGALVFGGLAIVLGLLSRGARKRAVSPARNAVILGIAAVCLSSVLLAFSFFFLIRQYGSVDNFMKVYMNTIERYMDTDPGSGTENPSLPYNPDDYL